MKKHNMLYKDPGTKTEEETTEDAVAEAQEEGGDEEGESGAMAD